MPKGVYIRTEQARESIRLSKLGKPRFDLRGNKHGQWKGDSAGVGTKHDWIKNHYGCPHECENCNRKGIPEGMKIYYDWANLSGKYLRGRSDWKRLCRPCHKKLDAHLMSRGEKSGMAKLTEKQVRVIKWALHYGATQRYLAKAFKISQITINDINTLKTWLHVKI